MKLAIVGATGTIGRQITLEALSRGHQVTAIVRKPSHLDIQHQQLKIVVGDPLEEDNLVRAIQGHDLLISAIGPNQGQSPYLVADMAHRLVNAVKKAHVERLNVVGGAGSLEIKPGLKFMDAPNFPADWIAVAQAHTKALEIYRQSDINWTYLSPPAMIRPGARTGKFRIGKDELLMDEKGESHISVEDYAVAFVDEIEQSQHLRQRFTVGY